MVAFDSKLLNIKVSYAIYFIVYTVTFEYLFLMVALVDVEGSQNRSYTMNGNEVIIKTENLEKSFSIGGKKQTIINDLDLEIYKGDFTVIMGSSGAGKSTLLYSLSGMDKPSMRRAVKGINRMTQVIFESEDGTVENNIEEELPYDINATDITLEDDDFGLWYIDVTEHPERYEGKTITFKGQVYRSPNFPSGTFVPARAAMTCCADDIQKIGFLCHWPDAEKLDVDSWVMVSIKVKPEFNPQYQQLYPILWADKVSPAEPPAEETVYFS